MNTYILLLIGAMALLEGVTPASREIDDRLNFIEPTSDNWLVPNRDKAKGGKSPYYANPAYQSQGYELQFKIGKKKSPLVRHYQQWAKSQQPGEDRPITAPVASQDFVPALESDNIEDQMTGTAGGVPPMEYTMPQSLHNHENKKKYHHSIMGGWIF